MLPASTQPERRDGTLSGARADFVAQLGRRVSELRVGLQALENDPAALRPRDDLKRRFHALGSAARVLKFQALADEMSRLEQLLVRSGADGTLDAAKLAAMRSDVDALVGLAWGEAADSRRSIPATPLSSPSEPEAVSWPATALVVGDASLAEGLLPEMGTPGDLMLDCERVDGTTDAVEMARALAPDVLVLDADLPGSHDLVERLANDPLTEPVPVVVVGAFSSAEKAARWVALGVARVLHRPFTPRQLQEACSSVIVSAHRPLRPEPFGHMNLDQLVERLSDELKRGLSEGAIDHGRKVPLALGDGHEVMAALWSAIVRIREAVTVRSSGMVRFQHLGPEGAVAVASWGDSRSGKATRSLTPPEEQQLDGRIILVVDDDPSVTWFLSGVLRASGASVLEAHDGEAALRLAYRHCPDLVISDILMPKLDGFALCRALKRDVVLRDAPVILLSWKEDLLQRVRELGANADGYLRKEASAAVVLERVFEVLRPRMRVERRLSSGGEVRGRLDDLTVRTLLAQVARLQPNARVGVRDSAFLYELEIRGGAPRSATRTTPDGRFERGPGVLFSLLGVGAGRFVVTPSDAPLRGWLDGSLNEQLRPAVAQIRAAQRLLSGTSMMGVQGVDLHLEAIQPYFEASPGVSRGILDKLAEGFSPRALLLRGGYSARLLEDVLNDAILHGGVARVVGNNGEDLLPSAVEQEAALLEHGIAISVPSEAPPAALYAQFTPSPMTAIVAPEMFHEKHSIEPQPSPRAASVSPGQKEAVKQPEDDWFSEMTGGADKADDFAPVPAPAPVASRPKTNPREESVRFSLTPSQGAEGSTVAPSWSRLPAAPSPIESALMEASPVPQAVAVKAEALPGSAPEARTPDTSFVLGTPLASEVRPTVEASSSTAGTGAASGSAAALIQAPSATEAQGKGAETSENQGPAEAPEGELFHGKHSPPRQEEAPIQAETKAEAPALVQAEVQPVIQAEAKAQPVIQAPVAEANATEAPKAEAPKAESPKAESPKVEAHAAIKPEAPAGVETRPLAETLSEAKAEVMTEAPAQELTPSPVVVFKTSLPVARASEKQAESAAPEAKAAAELAAEDSAVSLPAVAEAPEEIQGSPVEGSELAPEVAEAEEGAQSEDQSVAEERPTGGDVSHGTLPKKARAARKYQSPREQPRKESPKEPKKSGPWGWVIGVMLVVVGGSAWAVRGQEKAGRASHTAAAATTEDSKDPDPDPDPAPGASGEASGPRPLGIEDLPLQPGESVADGQGVLEVMAGRRDDVLVDRREAGKGPQVKMTLPPGVHEVRSRRKGDDQPLTVVIRAGRRTRVDLRGPWRR